MNVISPRSATQPADGDDAFADAVAAKLETLANEIEAPEKAAGKPPLSFEPKAASVNDGLAGGMRDSRKAAQDAIDAHRAEIVARETEIEHLETRCRAIDSFLQAVAPADKAKTTAKAKA